MSIKHALLGLLAEGPRHGYAVRALFEDRLGELSSGRVYELLSRLEEEGLAVRTSQRVGRRIRKVYSITSRGRCELIRWAHAAPSLSADLRELRLRLRAVGDDSATAASILRAWERHERRALATWRTERAAPLAGGGVFELGRRLTLEAEIRRAGAVLEALVWCREAIERHERGTPVREILRELGHAGGR